MVYGRRPLLKVSGVVGAAENRNNSILSLFP